MGFSQPPQHEGFGAGQGAGALPASTLLRGGQCWLLPSSHNAGTMAEWGEQDSA